MKPTPPPDAYEFRKSPDVIKPIILRDGNTLNE